MKTHHISLSRALELVRRKRPHVAPNEGFMIQLKNFEKSLGGKLASPIVDLLYIYIY